MCRASMACGLLRTTRTAARNGQPTVANTTGAANCVAPIETERASSDKMALCFSQADVPRE